MVPLNGNVIIERKDAESTTISGIILPGTVKEKPAEGKVIAVAKDVCSIEVGDYVMFGKYAGIDTTIKGNEYTVISSVDILCIL